MSNNFTNEPEPKSPKSMPRQFSGPVNSFARPYLPLKSRIKEHLYDLEAVGSFGHPQTCFWARKGGIAVQEKFMREGRKPGLPL
jgi:hypothetical protein